MNNNIIPENQPRMLTPELKNYAKQRSKISVTSMVVLGMDTMGFFFPLLLICTMIALTFDIISISDLIFDIFEEPTHPGFIITSIATNVPAFFLIVYLLIKKRFLYRKYCFVLINGVITSAEIRGIDLEWNVQLNDTPRSIVDIVVDGKMFTIKTFSPEILNYCHAGSPLQLVWYSNMPDIIIPVESLMDTPEKYLPETFVV